MGSSLTASTDKYPIDKALAFVPFDCSTSAPLRLYLYLSCRTIGSSYFGYYCIFALLTQIFRIEFVALFSIGG